MQSRKTKLSIYKTLVRSVMILPQQKLDKPATDVLDRCQRKLHRKLTGQTTNIEYADGEKREF